jgi:hypothetical protein
LTGYDFAGVVTSAGTNGTLTDINQNWAVNSFLNYQILLFSAGTPTPQKGTIQSNTANTITFAGSTWNSSVQYYPNNMVSDHSNNYTCISSNINSGPPNSNWQLLSWNAGNVYVVMSSTRPSQPYCIHCLGNYNYGTLANNDVRYLVLKTFSQYMGETIQYLPAGCRFDFGTLDTGAAASGAWTYVFLPDGEAWTLPPNAWNVYNGGLDSLNNVTYGSWSLMTYTVNGVVSGPKILGPTSPGLPAIQTSSGPQNCLSATIIVYGTTGQVISQ